MKSIIKYIKESYLLEGGNAVECNPIPASVALDIYNEVYDKIHKEDNSIEMAVLGSVGKKKDEDFNGDIDIAINIDSMKSLQELVNKVFSDCEIATPKGNTLSIGYKYDIKGKKDTGQVDFMICNDLEWAKFFWHSPNYKFNESKYKGGAAGDLLAITISEIPVKDKQGEFYDDGQVKTKWKHTLNSTGVWKQLLDYTGKKGPVKTPKRPKEIQELIAKNEDSVIKFLFGNNKVEHNDIYAAESLWKLLHSKSFLYPEVIKEIEKRYWDENAEKWHLDKKDFPC